MSKINVENKIYARCRSWMQECKKIRKFKRRPSKHNTNKKIYSGSVPTLYLHPLSKLLFGNSNPLNRIQSEYNVGTFDSSYSKLEYLFFGYKPTQYNIRTSNFNYSKLEHLFFRYKPTQYNPIQGSDQPFHILEPFQNKNNNSKKSITVNCIEIQMKLL